MDGKQFCKLKKSFLSTRGICSLFILIICFVSIHLYGQHRWQRMPSPVNDDLYDVFFLNDTLGWICSYVSSTVMHTSDGGQTWNVQARFDSLLFVRIQFFDASHGWLCGDRGVIYKTTDGGSSWINMSPGILKPFTEANNSWRVLFYNMYFFGPDKGFVMGVILNPRVNKQDFFFLMTEDGGQNWIPNESAPEEQLYATVFIDDKLGYTTGMGAVYRTLDRGRTWLAVYRGIPDQLRGLFFLNEKVGWACGFAGQVIRTTDGGNSWKETQVTSNRLRSIGFVDDMYGFAVGDRNAEDAVLYQTHDGGVSWHASELDCPDLFRMHLSPNAIWIVGKKGTILKGDRTVNLYAKEPIVIHIFTPEGKPLPDEFRLDDGRQVLVKKKEWDEKK